MSTEQDDLPADLSLGPVPRSHPRHQPVPAAPRPTDRTGLTVIRRLPVHRSGPVLSDFILPQRPGTGARGQGDMCRVPGLGCVPGIRHRNTASPRDLGWHDRTRTPQRSKDRHARQQGRRTRRPCPFPAHGGLALLLSDPLVRCPRRFSLIRTQHPGQMPGRRQRQTGRATPQVNRPNARPGQSGIGVAP
jgi:hypothetical protein